MNRAVTFSILCTFLQFSALCAHAQDSSGVTCLSRLENPIRTLAVASTGDYSYVSLGSSGICIVSTTDPAHSQEMGICDTPGSALELAVVDSFVYVADGNFGLRIINVADQTNPHEVGFYDTPGTASCVAISGTIAFVADGSAGLHAINIATPSQPQLVGTFTVPGIDASEVAISGNYAYVISGQLRIIDVSNPANMVQVNALIETNGSFSHIAVSGNHAYVTGQRNMASLFGFVMVVDVSIPTNLLVRGMYWENGSGSGGAGTQGSEIHCLTVSGNYAYLSSFYGWLDEQLPQPAFHREYYQRILDVTNPDSLRIHQSSRYGSDDFTGDCYSDFSISNRFYYTACGKQGLLYRSLPNMPLVAGWCLTFNVVDVDLTGNYAYLTDGDYLRTVNVSDPSHPQHAARFEQPGTITAVTISGNIAVVGTFQDVDTAWVSKVTLYNTANPDTLIRLGVCDLPDVPQDFEVRDSLIFIADQIGGLRIVHCGNPDSLYEISSVSTPDYAFGVKLSGNYAYVADYQRGLRVMDVHDPLHPFEAGFYDTPGFSMDVDVDGAYAYVADYDFGLRIIDISNPVSPHEVGFLDTQGTMSHVVKIGNYAYLADYSEGVRILNVSNPFAPHEVGYYNTQGNANRIAVNGNHLFVADGRNFGIYDCTDALGVVDRVGVAMPQEFSLRQNYPNPFNATTTISYDIPKAGMVEVKLFDVTGREVSTLVNFQQNPGTYKVTFDGKSLSTGTYFVRLQSGNFSQTKKMVLLK